MGSIDLCDKVQEQVTLCEEEYQRHADDSFLSHVLRSKRETLQEFLECLKEGNQAEELRVHLEEKLSQLEEDRDREAEYPSFSWYGEHYHYLVLDGCCQAYRCMLELLAKEMI